MPSISDCYKIKKKKTIIISEIFELINLFIITQVKNVLIFIVCEK